MPSDRIPHAGRRRSALPYAVIAILAAILLGVGIRARLAPPAAQSPHSIAERSLDFTMEDQDDGSISVYDAATHALVDTVPPKSNGFLRVVLAGLVRERRLDGIGSPTIPFHLTRWSDGRLTLDDAATHKLIELEAFGPTNEAAFGRLLDLSPRPATR